MPQSCDTHRFIGQGESWHIPHPYIESEVLPGAPDRISVEIHAQDRPVSEARDGGQELSICASHVKQNSWLILISKSGLSQNAASVTG